MFLDIIVWAMLWHRPAWWFWSSFSLCFAAFTGVFYYMRAASNPAAADLPTEYVVAAAAIQTAVSAAIFSGVGAIIVAVRRRKPRPTRMEADIDAELARIRAEASAREGVSTAGAAETEVGDAGMNLQGGPPQV